MTEKVQYVGKVAAKNEDGEIMSFSLFKVATKDKMGHIHFSYALSGDSGEGDKQPVSGTKWYNGTEISTPADSSSEISCHVEGAKVGDYYLNIVEPSIFECVSEDAWKFVASLGGGAESFFNCDEPLLIPHGGLKKDETFKNVRLQDVLYRILYPYVDPQVFASISYPYDGAVLEAGNSVVISQVQVSATKGTSDIVKLEVFCSDNPEEPVATITEDIADGGVYNVAIDNVVVSSGSVHYIAKVTAKDGKTAEASTGSFNFVYPYYVGGVDESVENPDIKSLTKKIETKDSKTIEYTVTNQRLIFAYPKSYGKLSKITDQNGFTAYNQFNNGTPSEITLVMANETPVEYYVYATTSAMTLANFDITFEY